MRHCAKCGHELGVGRYCTNCGHPADAAVTTPHPEWRTDTAERLATPAPTSPPPPPPSRPSSPPAGTPPPPPRFPLFADEAPPPPDDAEDRGDRGDSGLFSFESSAAPAEDEAPHQRRSWWPWLLAAAIVVVVITVGIVLLVGTGDDDSSARQPESSSPAETTPQDEEDPSPPAEDEPSQDTPDVTPGDVAADSTVEVPMTAPPGEDAAGNATTYEGANMLDGVPETAWRMPGDGSGAEVTFTLPGEARLRSVGLINGYDKVGSGAGGTILDWYHGNRRVTNVEWVFDDGSIVPQELGDTTEMQSIDVDATTSTVTLRLVSVSAPGKGAASRDYTAISDVSLIAR